MTPSPGYHTSPQGGRLQVFLSGWDLLGLHRRGPAAPRSGVESCVLSLTARGWGRRAQP